MDRVALYASHYVSKKTADFLTTRVVYTSSIRVMSPSTDPPVHLDARGSLYPGRSLGYQHIRYASLIAFPPYSLAFTQRQAEIRISFSTSFICWSLCEQS